MDEVGVVDRESLTGRSKLDQVGDIFLDLPAPFVTETRKVHRINLLAATLGDATFCIQQVVLVGKLIASQDHRHAHRCEQTSEAKLNTSSNIRNAVA